MQVERKNERGVELILDQYIEKCVLGYCQLSGRILLVKLKGRDLHLLHCLDGYPHRCHIHNVLAASASSSD